MATPLPPGKLFRRIIAAAFVFAGLLLSPAQAFLILTDVNTLDRKALTVDGVYTPALVQSLQGNGLYTLGAGNTDLKPDELKQIYQIIGTPFVMAEDGDFTVGNYLAVHSLTGRVDAYVSYYEQGWDAQFHIPKEATTTLSPARVSWVLDQLHRAGFNQVSQITVLTRAYMGDWVAPVDAALGNDQVGGILVEMNPHGERVRAWNIGELAKKTLQAGKNFYLLLPPAPDKTPGYNYSKQMEDEVNALRESDTLRSDHVFLVPAIYGTQGTTWFGPDGSNSIQAGISILKQQPEWNKEGAGASAAPDATNKP